MGPGVKSSEHHNRRFQNRRRPEEIMRRLVVLVLGTLALVGGSFISAPRVALADDALKVAVPQKGAWDAGIAELGERGGIFKKHGLDLDILYTTAGPESIQAMIAGSIDISVAAGVSAAIGTFGKGAPVRIISSEMTGAPDLYWFVPADSPIHTIADMNDKTVAFSAVGSSSHGSLLALIAQYHLTAKPTPTGNIASTITQTMTKQVDVGFGAAPFGLDLVESGKARIIATGNDVAALRTRAVRVNLTGASTLQNRHDMLVRFMQGYKETVDWMYSSPEALKIYGEYSGLPDSIVQRVIKLIPKEALQTDQVMGINDIMTDAVAQKFLSAPLTPDQIKELIQIQK
jgi:NitT/TauT family transport system substrate-binding protein